MPAASVNALQQRGLFAFDAGAVATIDAFFAEADTGAPALLRELVTLTAAEFGLVPLLIADPGEGSVGPVPVSVPAARLALLKANTIVIEYCGAGRRPSGLTLADVTAFAGDAAKLTELGVSADSPPTDIGAFTEYVTAFERAHAGSPSAAARALAVSGVLRLQGFLWAVKLSLGTRPVEDAVAIATAEVLRFGPGAGAGA